MNVHKRLVVVIMDLLLLAELTLCMYLSAPHGKAMAAVFLKTYVPMASATGAVAWILLRRLGKVALEPRGEH